MILNAEYLPHVNKLKGVLKYGFEKIVIKVYKQDLKSHTTVGVTEDAYANAHYTIWGSTNINIRGE